MKFKRRQFDEDMWSIGFILFTIVSSLLLLIGLYLNVDFTLGVIACFIGVSIAELLYMRWFE